MDVTKVSRRRFIGTTIAAGLGVCLSPGEPSLGLANSAVAIAADELTLEVEGDDRQGYAVAVSFKGERVARCGGEFSAVFQNGERSLEDRIDNWRATSWSGNDRHLVLTGMGHLSHLNTTVSATLDYEIVAPRVIRKRIQLHQVDIDVLLVQITNRLEPTSAPAKFWSFDQVECHGGALHEYFPADGFRTTTGLTVGLLTDTGFHNQWSRIIRRDGRPVKPAPGRIPDPRLYSVCTEDEQNKGEFFVQQTFGESLVHDADVPAAAAVSLPSISSWSRQGGAMAEAHDGVIVVSAAGSEAGVVIPFSGRAGDLLSLHLEYRSPQAFAAQIWDVDDHLQKVQEFTLYNDRIPESPGRWSEFRTTVFLYSMKGRGAALFISPPPTEQAINSKTPAGSAPVEFRTIELRRLPTSYEPYHRLEMDCALDRTSFVFVDDRLPDDLRGYRLSSQIHLAEALGFKGGETEKVVYADLMMLGWTVGSTKGWPMVAPSIWYSAAGEMYLRDSFFALNGIHHRELNEGVFEVWAANQGADGAINTLLEPNFANLERKSNDSTPLWLIWALQNRRRFGTALPMEKVRKAAEYCVKTYDRNHDGSCWAQFVMGQLDVISFPEGSSDICENQGLLAVTLRVIKELKISGVSDQISERYIEQAEETYRSYYDPVGKFVKPARGISDAIGFGEIFPEFLSLWLFDRKILADEMVQNHLDRIPVLMPQADAPYPEMGGCVRPIFIGLKEGGEGWSYFTEKWHPMISSEHGANYANHSMDGIYYNGGSWMRIEICGYVAGKLHGWSKAQKSIANRLWAEVHISPEYPTSQEYLATDPAHPFFGYHRVFAWNAFALQALEFAGLRSPEMDPGYSKKPQS